MTKEWICCELFFDIEGLFSLYSFVLPYVWILWFRAMGNSVAYIQHLGSQRFSLNASSLDFRHLKGRTRDLFVVKDKVPLLQLVKHQNPTPRVEVPLLSCFKLPCGFVVSLWTDPNYLNKLQTQPNSKMEYVCRDWEFLTVTFSFLPAPLRRELGEEKKRVIMIMILSASGRTTLSFSFFFSFPRPKRRVCIHNHSELAMSGGYK